MTGHAMSAEEEEELAKEFSAGLDPKVAAAIRSVFYELRCQSAKAARACVACKSFWEQPNSSQWIKATAETLRAVKPHVAEMLLREIFLPLVRNEALLKDSDIASAGQELYALGLVVTLSRPEGTLAASAPYTRTSGHESRARSVALFQQARGGARVFHRRFHAAPRAIS